MKKKLIALFLVVATLFSCVFAFAACDKDKDKGGNGNTNENFTEEDIVSLIGKIATYIITKSNQSQMGLIRYPSKYNLEENKGTEKLNWTFHYCGNYIVNYETEEAAKNAIPLVSPSPLFVGKEIKQRGNSLMIGSEAFFNAILNGEDRSVELLSQEFVDEYKSIFKSVLNGNNDANIIFYLSDLNGSPVEDDKTEYKIINVESMITDSKVGKDTNRYIAKLVDDATAEELGAFEKYCKEKGDSYKKINDRLYFMSETSEQ